MIQEVVLKGSMIENIYQKIILHKYPVPVYIDSEKTGTGGEYKIHPKSYVTNFGQFVNVFFPYHHYFIKLKLCDPYRRQFVKMLDNGFDRLMPYVIKEDSMITLFDGEERDDVRYREYCKQENTWIYNYFNKNKTATDIKISDLRKLVLRDFLELSVKRLGTVRGGKKTLKMSEWKNLFFTDINSVADKYHGEYESNRDKMIDYIMKLPDEIKDSCDEGICKWVDGIYYYLYYAITKKAHFVISQTSYKHWEEDLDEYNRSVAELYGNSSDPGFFKVYEMANRANKPNIIALFELADKYYYGFTYDRAINHQQAYYYYEKVLELHPEHPLTLWSLSYIRFHYKSTRKYKYRIEELEEELGDKTTWNKKIVDLAVKSYKLGCPPAVNFIGKLLESNNGEIRELLKKELRLPAKSMDEMIWFKEAAQRGYLFAYNNCAMHFISRAHKEDDPKKEKRYWLEAQKYLEHSVYMGEPWGCNSYANYMLYNGVRSRIDRNVIILEADKEKAYDLFQQAKKMRQPHYYWPLVNLCEKYWFDKKSEKYRGIPYSRLQQELEDAINDPDVEDENLIDSLMKLKRSLRRIDENEWEEERKQGAH